MPNPRFFGTLFATLFGGEERFGEKVAAALGQGKVRRRASVSGDAARAHDEAEAERLDRMLEI